MAVKKKKASPVKRANRTDIKKAQALEGYVEKGTVTAACKKAKMGRRTWYDWMEADPEFAKAADNAYEQVTDSIEQTAVEKAQAGDTTLCIFLLKNRRHEVYGEKQEITGPGGGPLVIQRSRKGS